MIDILVEHVLNGERLASIIKKIDLITVFKDDKAIFQIDGNGKRQRPVKGRDRAYTLNGKQANPYWVDDKMIFEGGHE